MTQTLVSGHVPLCLSLLMWMKTPHSNTTLLERIASFCNTEESCCISDMRQMSGFPICQQILIKRKCCTIVYCADNFEKVFLICNSKWVLCGCACVREQVIGVSHCWWRAAGAEKRMETSAIWNLVRNLWSAKMFSPRGGSEPAASATVSHLVHSLWARHQAEMAREIHTQILYITSIFAWNTKTHTDSLRYRTRHCKHGWSAFKVSCRLLQS